ncbi:MAG: hypothetical protein IID39_07520, partial [Planctomycetes bacterium]|nr:hypothetical protein [Planctomycetota bacterium]
MLIGCLLLGFGWAAGEDDDLATARRQFERHNYKLALTAAERYLSEAVDDESITEVMAIRGQCLIKLRQFEEGVAVLEELLTKQSGAGEQAELHVALAQVGLRNHQYRYLSIKHFGRASKLYESAGDLEAAAVAALHCGNAYVHFNAWKKLDDPDIEVPSEWRDQRALQRDLAVRSLDRALDLAQTETTAAAAMFRKASVYERDLRLDPTDVEKALELYRTLVSRWPTTAKSPLADLQVARILERHKQDYVAAVRQYELTLGRYPNTRTSKRAAEAIERIVAPVVRTWMEGPILPGEPVEIQLEIRNVETLDFRAYRVDLFALARQVGSIRMLNRWEPEGAPVASWSLKTPDIGEHRRYSTRSATLEPTTAPIHEPGMYVIEAISQNASNRSVRTVTPVIVSRLAVVAKGGKDQSLLWAVDTVTGRPVSGADFLVQVHLGRNQYDYQRGRSNDAGFFRASEDERRTKRGGRSLTVYARDGEHVAVCSTWTHWYWWGYPSGYRLYAFTDRPVYRPAQVIHFKHVLRRYDMGDYETVAGKWLTLRVHGPEGEVVDERELRTNEHGSVSGDLMLPSGAALGMYRMQVEVDGRYVHTGQGGRFRVEEYRKPEFEVTVSAAKQR